MIEFSSVTKLYNHTPALDDVSFEIEEKEFTFLIGASGSGKTTIIRLLIREEEPTAGNIFFYDTNITSLKPSQVTKLRREIGVVFQDFKLLPHKNLFENVAFALEVSGKKQADIEETVNYVLELVSLSDRAEAFPNEISGGEKQKIAIARAVANNPKVLIADEPTGNLDPKSSWEIIDLLSKINQWGTTVIMATHGSDIVNTLGRRVIQLDKGKIVADNKQGSYPIPVIPIETPKVKVQEQKDNEAKDQELKKKIKPEEEKAEEEKEVSEPKDGVEEKEFEISFTTKQKLPTSKKTKKKKRKGKDVVDLHKLNLPSNVEEALIKADISSIKQLKDKSKEALEKIQGLNAKDIKKVFKALEK